MTDKTALERLDDLVRWTGIPALSERPPRRRSLRWPATAALALAFGGAGMATAAGFVGSGYWIGYASLMLGFVIGNFTNMFGPLKPPTSLVERSDEWDKAARAQAYLVTFGVFAGTTVLGLMAILVTLLFHPVDAAAKAVTTLLFLLLVVGLATPAAYASWRWRWDDER